MKAGTRHAGWFMAGATAAALGLLSPVAWAQPKPPQEVYTCIDKTGRRITADRPIADCVSRSASSCWCKVRVEASRSRWRVATSALVGISASLSAKVRATASGSSATSQIRPHSLA